MFYCATVVPRETRITHTLYHCQLSVIQLLTNIKQYFLRERQKKREKERQTDKTDGERERESLKISKVKNLTKHIDLLPP